MNRSCRSRTRTAQYTPRREGTRVSWSLTAGKRKWDLWGDRTSCGAPLMSEYKSPAVATSSVFACSHRTDRMLSVYEFHPEELPVWSSPRPPGAAEVCPRSDGDTTRPPVIPSMPLKYRARRAPAGAASPIGGPGWEENIMSVIRPSRKTPMKVLIHYE